MTDLDLQTDEGEGVHLSADEDGTAHLSVAEGHGYTWGTASAFLTREQGRRMRAWLDAWLDENGGAA